MKTIKKYLTLLILSSKLNLTKKTANYTVRRVLQILSSLQTSHLPYYDKLFHKHFSFPYYNDLRKYLPFYFSNITKIRNFKNQKRFSHHINKFLDAAVLASNYNSISLQMQKERQNELYLRIAIPLIFSVTVIFIAMITLKASQESLENIINIFYI